MKFPAQSSNQSTNQLDVTSGKFDWSYNFLPNVKQTYVAKDPTHNTYWFPPGGTIGLFLNLTKAPYQNVDFRTGHLARAEPDDHRAEGGQRLHHRRQLVGPDPAEPAELPRPEPAEQGSGRRRARPQALAAFQKAGYTMQGGKLTKDGQAGLVEDLDAGQLQ